MSLYFFISLFIYISISCLAILDCYYNVEKTIEKGLLIAGNFISELVRRVIDAGVILFTGRQVYDLNPNVKIEHVHFEENELRVVYEIDNPHEWDRIQREIKIREITIEEYFKEYFIHLLKDNIKEFIYIERLDRYDYKDDYQLFDKIGGRMIVGKKKSFL